MLEEDLAGLVADLRAHPDDDVVRMILADALDEAGPTPVDLHRIPEWLRVAWLRCRPRDAVRHRGNVPGYLAAQEIHAWLEMPGGPWIGTRWDHWGVTTVAGLSCLVSEPCCSLDDAPRIFEPLAQVIPGAAHAFARESHWDRGRACRGLLLPPLQATLGALAGRRAKEG